MVKRREREKERAKGIIMKEKFRTNLEQKDQGTIGESEVFDTTRYPHGCSTDEKVGWIDRRSACEC